MGFSDYIVKAQNEEESEDETALVNESYNNNLLIKYQIEVLRKELAEKRRQKANKEIQKPLNYIEELETQPDMDWNRGTSSDKKYVKTASTKKC